MFALSACQRLRNAAQSMTGVRQLSSAAAQGAAPVMPLTKLWRGIKKAPKAKGTKQQGAERVVAAQEQPYHRVPEGATPKMMSTDLMTFLNWRAVARRRETINIPVFAPGSILQISALDNASSARARTFVGICIARSNNGYGSTVTLRNSVDDIAIEKQYHLYSPLIKEVKVLKYERARRAKLYYLRKRPARESYVNPKSYGLHF